MVCPGEGAASAAQEYFPGLLGQQLAGQVFLDTAGMMDQLLSHLELVDLAVLVKAIGAHNDYPAYPDGT